MNNQQIQRELLDGWRWVALTEVAQIIMGQSPPGNTYNEVGEGLPFFQGKAEFGEVHPTPVKWCIAPQRIAEAGDILMSVRAPVGPTNLARERCCIGRGLAAIRPNPEKMVTEFLLHYFRFIEPHLAAKGQGSTFTAIGKNDLHGLQIPLPPLPTQRCIADLLNRADALRRQRAAAARRAADFLPALFSHTFGDPATNPRGWEVVRLGEVIQESQYGTSQKASTNGEGVPVIRMNNIGVDGSLDLSDLKYVVLDSAEWEKQRLREGDILFNRTNSKELVGKTGLWDGHCDAVAASYLIRVRLDTKRVASVYVWAFMNSPHMKRVLFGMARGAIGQSNINAKELAGISLPLPPLPLQHRFAAQVEAFRAVQAQQAASRARLDELFQSLLHRAFRGEL